MKRSLSLILFLAITHPTWPAVYNAAAPSSLHPGESIQVWSAEQPTPGNGGNAASQQVILSGSFGGNTPFHAHGFFSAAPGAFEIDVQVSENDVDAQYQTVSNGNITTVDATNQTFHLDCNGCGGRFARLLMRSRANSVTVTASLGR